MILSVPLLPQSESPKIACFVPANPPEVDASTNPFSGRSMGVASTTYTTRTMIGVRRAEQRTKPPITTG